MIALGAYRTDLSTTSSTTLWAALGLEPARNEIQPSLGRVQLASSCVGLGGVLPPPPLLGYGLTHGLDCENVAHQGAHIITLVGDIYYNIHWYMGWVGLGQENGDFVAGISVGLFFMLRAATVLCAVH